MKRREGTNAAPGVALALLALFSVAGCGGEDLTNVATKGQLRPEPDPSSASDAVGANVSGDLESEHVRTSRASDGTYASEIDATDTELWVYFNLETAAEVATDSPLWHLGFQRSNVKLNGGVSGTGEVSVASLDEPFEAVVSAPAGDYLEDAADQNMDGSPDYALSAGDGWYSYDPATHLLTARATVFVIQTPDGFFKLQFLSYYDAAGTPGAPSFRWARLGG